MLPLWLGQDLITLGDTRECLLSSPALRGLLEDARALRMEGHVLCLVLENVVRLGGYGIWSLFLPSHFLEPSDTFLRIPGQFWHLHLISCRQMSCPGSREPGSNSTAFTWKTAHRSWENALCQPLPTIHLMPCPLSCPTPSSIIMSQPYFSGGRCRSRKTLPQSSRNSCQQR